MKAIFLIFVAQWVLANGAVISFGGEDVIQEVHKISENFAKRISNVPQFLLPEKNLYSRIRKEMTTLNIIVSSEPLIWEGTEVFGINFPFENPKRLVISAQKWKMKQAQSQLELESLVLHELLPIIGIMDRDYVNSQNILKVLNGWQSWNSTDYFMKRYFENSDFLAVWAERSKEYYEGWGVDNDQLFSYFAFRVFPVKSSDTGYWLKIFESYLGQYSTNICFQPEFGIQVKNIKLRTVAVYSELYRFIKTWYHKRCSGVPGSRSLD